MRIVADTNTLVSGFGWGGPPGQVVDSVLSGQVTLVISPALLGELARVLAYPKLTAVFDDPAALVAAVAEAADAVDPSQSAHGPIAHWSATRLPEPGLESLPDQPDYKVSLFCRCEHVIGTFLCVT